ncbi:MAG: hypothetical protein AAFS08_18040 [Pseudomonadota bacterium]
MKLKSDNTYVPANTKVKPHSQHWLSKLVLFPMATCAAISSAHANGSDEPIGARLYFDYLHAKHITTERGSGRLRDEVKIRVIGRGANGLPIDHTLPSTNIRDDYLQFWTGDVATCPSPVKLGHYTWHRRGTLNGEEAAL